MTPSQAHRYLASFQRVGLVYQDPTTRRYCLGDFAIRLGAAMASRRDSRVEIAAHQRDIRDRLGMTVILSEWTDRGPVVITVEEADSDVIPTMRIGKALPLLSTAAGRVFASFREWDEVQPRLSDEILSRSPDTSSAELSEQLKKARQQYREIRQRGFESRLNSLQPHISSIAVPFVDGRDHFAAVLCVIGDSDVLDISSEGAAAKALAEASRDFRRRIPGVK